MTALLHVSALTKSYEGGSFWSHGGSSVTALRDISFELARGKTLAIVGESGSGKSTLARILAGLENPSSGFINIMQSKQDSSLNKTTLQLRKTVRMIFQDPSASLNPRLRIATQFDYALQNLTGKGPRQRQEAINEALLKVGLQPDLKSHYPHQFSGGQRQRIAIARAILLAPQLIIADEPISTLDASVQAQIVNLLSELQRELGLSYVYISHDLGMVRHISDDVMVLYGGVVMEFGPSAAVFSQPAHPYTKILIASSPSLQHHVNISNLPVRGEQGSPAKTGCPFYKRCPMASIRCANVMPHAKRCGDRIVLCHYA